MKKKININWKKLKSPMKDWMRLLLFILFLFSLYSFDNRFDLSLTDKEDIQFDKEGRYRTFFEHFLFFSLGPLLVASFYFGVRILLFGLNEWKKNNNYFLFAIFFIFIFLSFCWEFQKRPVEIIEIIYDIIGLVAGYLFIKYFYVKNITPILTKPSNQP